MLMRCDQSMEVLWTSNFGGVDSHAETKVTFLGLKVFCGS